MKKILYYLILAFLTGRMTDAFSQDKIGTNPKEYMSIVTKERSFNKIFVYVSYSNGSDSIFQYSYDALEPFFYSPLLKFISLNSKNGWKIVSSNLSFESTSDENSHVYILLERDN